MSRVIAVLASLLVLGGCAHHEQAAPPTPAPAPSNPAATVAPVLPAPKLRVPLEFYTLPNGLKVVLSRDNSLPTAMVAVYYHIGFRSEPRNRTGFAHLFEHMMFQGSQNLGKMQFIQLIQKNGGVLNGSTRFDATNYYEEFPSNVLETILWAEADRMRGLAVTQDNLKNQQGVVESEVRVNVLNHPFGAFPWLDLPQAANVNWNNAHNFYGDLKDLEAASLSDVQQFFHQNYVPNNAVLVVNGDFDTDTAKGWVTKYFGSIPKGQVPTRADTTEPKQTAEKTVTKTEKLAKQRALAVGYHMPPRNSKDFWAMAILTELLADGRDGALYQELVQKRGLTGDVQATANSLGSQYDYEGPSLWSASLFYDADKKPADVLAGVDAAIEPYRQTPVDAATLARAKVKARSAFYSVLESENGLGKVDVLASYALYDNDPGAINRVEPELMSVTAEQVQQTAKEWLRTSNRTVLNLEPGIK